MIERVITGAVSLFKSKFKSKSQFFKPENAGESYEYKTDRYRLVITPIKTKEGCWNYTNAKVYQRKKDGPDEQIAVVRRNYSAFPFEWVEKHPNGHEYLVCGEDYQGQTIIELDTGKRADYLPEDAKKGFGFCCGHFYISASGRYLAVSGCYWACPYEVRIFDFSEPLKMPWPELYRDTDRDTFIGWDYDENGEFAEIGKFADVCKFNGKTDYNCTEQDFEEITKEAERLDVSEDDLWEEKNLDVIKWSPKQT